MKWLHRDGEDARAPRISFGPREKSPISDRGMFEAPEREEVEEHLREQGHTPLDEATSNDEDQEGVKPLDPSDEVTDVNGVGPATAEDLEPVANTVGELADLDPSEHEDVASLIEQAQAHLDA